LENNEFTLALFFPAKLPFILNSEANAQGDITMNAQETLDAIAQSQHIGRQVYKGFNE